MSALQTGQVTSAPPRLQQRSPQRGAPGTSYSQARGVLYPELERRPSRQPVKPRGILDISTAQPGSRRRVPKLSTPFAEKQIQKPSPDRSQQLAAIPELHAATGQQGRSGKHAGSPTPALRRSETGFQRAPAAANELETEQSADVLAASTAAFTPLDAPGEPLAGMLHDCMHDVGHSWLHLLG